MSSNIPKGRKESAWKNFCSLACLVAKSSQRDFWSSLTNCKPLVLAGKIIGKASLVPLAAAGAVEDDVAFDDFLGRDGPLEGSLVRCLPIVEIIVDLDSEGDEKGRSSVNSALYNLKSQQLRFLGFRERK